MTPVPRRHELTDEQWEKLEPLLPPQKPRTGRPNKDHRTIINGILWILKTGAPREDPPAPPQKPRTGRPNKDHRTIINGILWILKTGAQWEDLPERYGSPKTVSS